MPITTHCTCGQSIDGRCHSSIDGCEQLFLTNVDNHYKMEENNYPGSSYQNLFNYLHEEHGLTLLQSQMDDLISMVHKFHLAGAVWVKASDFDMSKGGMLFYRFDGPTLKSIGIGHFVGDVFHGTHLDVFPKPDWKYLYVLDESATPVAAREEDAVSFAEWLNSNYISVENKDGKPVYVEYGPQEYDRKKQYRIEFLYAIFKQQKQK